MLMGEKMKLYNSLSGEKEDFVPHDEKQVTMYTCGPTVYHFAHIGNLRSYIMEDVLERSLNFLGYNVKRAMNITDVGHLSDDGDDGEDKMLKGAEREHKTVMEIAKMYTEAFKKDCKNLNLKWPEIVVPATSCIGEYIKIIKTLLEKGYAYQSNGNIYFDTSKLDSYYKFGNQLSEDLVVGARESVGEDAGKKNTNDFVLWFTKSKFENHALKWNSPWGEGYPGWHIECSGISHKYLGERLDIHCGGVDNKFPHHTNEIAQTESYVGHKWCNYWFHVEHLNTKTGKMSKSSGEFLTLDVLNNKGYSPMVYKFFCLQSHYRKQLVFSFESLDMAKSAYEKLIKRVNNLQVDDSEIDLKVFNQFREQFASHLANDINTAMAITTVFDVLKDATNDRTKAALIKEFDKVLALDLASAIGKQEQIISDELQKYIEKKIAERTQAKQDKNFTLADSIRQELNEKGIELIDSKEGTTFKIK